MLLIQPWEKSLIKSIEKAILTSDLGLNPSNDGSVIRLIFPEMTEERRKQLAKDVKKKGEYFMEQIQKIDSKIIKEVRGKGLMIGIVVDENQRMSLINQLLKDGLLVLSAGKDVIRLLPPLIITYEQINEAIEKMKGVFL